MSADRHIPTLEDQAFEQCLHERGLRVANYVAGVERENCALRQLLDECNRFVPVRLQAKIAAFLHDAN